VVSRTRTSDAGGDRQSGYPLGVDQAALHGVLRKVRDSGLMLLSVMRIEPGQAAALDAEQ
jgi:hypothetical protein